jgi:GNAT superfamily N-acetyltransferase
MPTLAELAESTAAYLRPQPRYDKLVTESYTYIGGPNNAWILQIDEPDVEWARAETRRRGLTLAEWWVGWSTPPAIAGALLGHGLVPDEEPVLTGMTCTAEPPAEPQIDVRRLETAEQYLAAIAVDWEVWNVAEPERERRRATEVERFDENQTAGTVHNWAAYVDETPVGFGRAIDMDDGAALMGGAVLPSARGRGIYRALVHARWQHAVDRGAPLLVVQAGRMSAPVLAGLGFEAHGEIRLFADRLEADPPPPS